MPIDSPGIASAYLAGPERRLRATYRRRRSGAWIAAIAAAVLALGALVALADDAPADIRSLDGEVGALKQQVVDLNRDLFLLEEELLFPANTQLAVFVSMDVGTFFGLDSVQIVLNGKEVTNYLYTGREVDALARGGVHRVWLGNLKAGKHELSAFFTGVGPHGRDYRRGATLEIDKGVGAKYVELRISDRVQKLQPEFVVREWD
ncbi:MAG: hypothetical protein MUC71_03885 [Steroidobacteraceae bacterium]|jgi:hypothetical protein|nr:hypothetical protein [Steroidobacteraceae bacterium]